MRNPKTLIADLKKITVRLAKSERGVSAIEFGMLMSVLLLFVIGLSDFGIAVFRRMELESAVRSGAQFAIYDREDTDSIKDAVVAATNLGLTTSDVTTTEFCECPDETTATCGDTGPCTPSVNYYFMTITAQHSYTPILLPGGSSDTSGPFKFLDFIPATFELSGSITVRTQ